MSYLHLSDLPFKNFIYSQYSTVPVLDLVIVKNKLTSVFYASVLLLKINFVITLSKFEIKFETRTCTRCFMQMSYLYEPDLRFKSFIYSRYLTSFGSCYCKKQIDVSFLCVCPLIEDKFRHNIVKV